MKNRERKEANKDQPLLCSAATTVVALDCTFETPLAKSETAAKSKYWGGEKPLWTKGEKESRKISKIQNISCLT